MTRRWLRRFSTKRLPAAGPPSFSAAEGNPASISTRGQRPSTSKYPSFVKEKSKTSTAKESQSICLLYTPQMLFFKGAFDFLLETQDFTSNAVLSFPVLCPVLYCYIHSRTDFNFWVISLCFKLLTKLTYTLVKNHNNPSISWLCYCSCVFLRLG